MVEFQIALNRKNKPYKNKWFVNGHVCRISRPNLVKHNDARYYRVHITDKSKYEAILVEVKDGYLVLPCKKLDNTKCLFIPENLEASGYLNALQKAKVVNWKYFLNNWELLG